jgi:hypothetical protein
MRRPSCFACLPFLILFLAVPFLTWAGVIRTIVTSHTEINKKGQLYLKLDIRNQGNATAHNVKASLIISNIVREYPDLGDNPAGGKISFSDRFDFWELMPGRYQGVIRVDFEEQNGKNHFAYHLFDVSYGKQPNPPPNLPVTLKTVPPRFNRKAFWDKTDDLQIMLKNRSETIADVQVNLFLPEGFESPESGIICRLVPGEEKAVNLPIQRQPEGKNARTFHLVMDYDLGGRHYAEHIEKQIRVEEYPVFFKWYVIFSVIILSLLLMVLLVFRRRRSL